MSEEKRKYERFSVKEGAFAAFVNPNELINMGRIQNIGMGGLCVRYLSMERSSEDRSAIKIFGSNGRFIHLERVRCRVVYDYELPEGSWEQISTKCCGVEFEDLSVRHRSILEDFIDTFCLKPNRPEASEA